MSRKYILRIEYIASEGAVPVSVDPAVVTIPSLKSITPEELGHVAAFFKGQIMGPLVSLTQNVRAEGHTEK